MSKRNLLKKIAKGASVALLAGVMVCGASLTNVNASSNSSAASEENGIRNGKYNSHNLGATAPKINKNRENNNGKRPKNIRRSKDVKKSNKKTSKKSTKRSKKVAKPAKKGSKKNAKKISKRVRKAIAKKASKPSKRLMNRRHSNKRVSSKRVHMSHKNAYYRNIWSKALNDNKKGIRKDEKAIKFDQKRGYKRAVKYLRGKINYLNGYVRHDIKMLNLR